MRHRKNGEVSPHCQGNRMLSAHTVKSFDLELQRLERTLGSMGKLVAVQLDEALKAITSGHHKHDQDIDAHDARIDHLAREVDGLTLEMLALRQPLALDLRAIIASLRISIDLERIGDYAANLAKRSRDLRQIHLEKPIQAIVKMGNMALKMLQDSLDAYHEQNSEIAVDIWHRDHFIDHEYTSLLHEMHDAMLAEPDSIAACTHLLFAARGIERVGDHITNIAEHIYFLVEGGPLQQRTVRQAGQNQEEGMPRRTSNGR
jgi:phosphate transport system protein